MGEAAAEASGRPHVVAIPYPMMGHMTPVVQLCKILIAKAGCRVTIACVPDLGPSLRKLIPRSWENPQRFTVVPISDGQPDPASSDPRPVVTYDTLRENVDTLHHAMRRSFKEQVATGAFADAVCVISDLFLSWTQDAADELGIPRIALWIATAAEFQVYFHAKELIREGKLPFKAPKGREIGSFDEMLPLPGKPAMYHRVDDFHPEADEEIEIPSLPTLRRGDFPSFLQIEDASDPLFYHYIEHIQTCQRAYVVLFNSCEALDGRLLATMRGQGVNAQFIGPLPLLEERLIPPEVLDTQGDEKMKVPNARNGDGYEECLEWLDTQRPNSVLYVAFGTLVQLEEAQVRELALGLLSADHSFIWVYPPGRDGTKRELPNNFLNQTKGKGLVVEWVPQKSILKHPSIGAFLSHCGWNSTMEAIWSGVPLLCLPSIGDQFVNCKMVVDEWNVGLKIRRTHANGIASANEISELTQEILVGTKGDKLRKRAQDLKLELQTSVQVDGSSLHAVNTIIELVTAAKR